MLTAARPMPLDMHLGKEGSSFPRWLRSHKGALAMAALLAFAAPLTFFTGALSVMRAPTAIAISRLGLWWTLYGVSLWGLLLVTGYGCERLARPFGRHIRGGMWLLAACLAAVLTNVLTAGRATILIEQGLVQNAQTMQVHGLTVSFIMALLYFAHLRRSREHEEAAARLATAQTAQRNARRCLAEARLQELQARIDPQLLFEMLEAVRDLYERDAARAERFLDELILFLRAALPRLRTASSSLLREVDLARAFVRLRALASADGLGMTIDIAPDAMHARFPPGVLLPLLDTVVRGSAGPCRLTATRSGEACRLVLTLDAAPLDASIARAQSLLMELHGTAGKVEVKNATGAVKIIVEVPYEHA
jgi:hypothetical protein